MKIFIRLVYNKEVKIEYSLTFGVFAMKVISRITVFPLVSALFLGLASSARADLVAHWAFDEAAGATTAADSTGTYPATPSNTSITFGDAGKFGNAVTFDGTTASSQLTYSGLQGIYDTSVSFSFWVKVPETTNTGGQVIGAWQNSWGYRIYFSNDQRKLSFDARSSSDGYAHYNTYGASTGNLVADQWNHVVVVLDRENNKTYTYLNGNFANGNTYASMGPLWESTGVSGMGWKQDQAGGGLLNGSLDEMYVYNSALTEQQVHGLMYNNNINEFVVANPYVQTENKVLLGALFGVSADSTVPEAMATGGYFGAQATTGNLGIAYATKAAEISSLNQVVDVTNDGLMVDLSSINAGNTYGANVQNAKCNVAGLRTTGKFFNETISVAGSNTQTANIKIDEGIGMHANALVTFNVAEICEKNGWDPSASLAFTCSKAGMNDEGSGSIDQVILVSDANHNILGSYVNGNYAPMTRGGDGTYSFDSAPTTHLGAGKLYDVDFLLPEGAKYLTLATTTSNITSAHGVFGQAHLRLVDAAPISEESPIYLNRLASMGASGTTGTGILAERMAVNGSVGAEITTSTFGVDTILGNLNNANGLQLASSAPWKFDFTKNFNSSNYTEGHIYNCKCGANVCDRAWNPLLGTADAPNDFIGLHAEKAITIDLSDIREAGCLDPNQPLQFTVTATGMHTVNAPATPIILVSNDDGILEGYVSGVKYDVTQENGIWYFDTSSGTDYNQYITNGASADFDITLGSNAKFLTLAYSGYGDANTDHFTWLNPMLVPISTEGVPEPTAWVLLLLGLLGLKFMKRQK